MMEVDRKKKIQADRCTKRAVNHVIDILRANNCAELCDEFIVYRSMFGDENAIKWICAIMKVYAINTENNHEK